MSAMDKAFPCVTRLKEMIHYLGKSPEEVAAAVGISPRTIYNYMSGTLVVPAALRPKLCHRSGMRANVFVSPPPRVATQRCLRYTQRYGQGPRGLGFLPFR